MDRIWERIEDLVANVVAGGLAGPADPASLDAVGVPAPWRGLWERHDGQTDVVGNLFLGYWFLPLRGSVDSAQADAGQVPDGYLPIAKDFSGGYLVLDTTTGFVQELTDDGETVIIATTPLEFLERVQAGLVKEPPRRWVQGEGGRRVPEGHRSVELADLVDWAVGEARDLPHGLVAVRVRSPDPAPFPQHGTRLDFTVDHPEDPGANGQLLGARLVLPTGLEGTGTDASAGVASQGDEHWIEATGPMPRTAVLHLDLDLGAPIRGPRPLLTARGGRASVERARARLLLGDPAGALADLEQLTPTDVPLATECALAAGDGDTARRFAEQLGVGHPLRLRVWAEREPVRARQDADELVSRRPNDGVSYVWRADVFERLGEFSLAAADTEQALALLSLGAEVHLPGLRAALRRRRARIAAPRTDAPVLEDSTEDFVIGNVVKVESVGAEWSASVHVTPREASTGRLVEFEFPDGERGAVRLPPGAGDGVRTTVRVGGGGQAVRVTIVVDLPFGWRSDGDNTTLAFDRWDVVAPVPRWKPKVRVVGLDGEAHVVDWPEGEVEVAVSGGGLGRSDGTRGKLRICVARPG